MDDKAHGGFALTFFVTSLSLVAYFFLFPFPLASELTALPRWAVSLESARVSGEVPSGGGIPFSASGAYGYFSADGTIYYLDKAKGGAAVTEGAYALLDEPALYSAATRARIAALSGTPFFAGGDIYAAAADGTQLLSYGPDGARKWSYHFPSPLSAFASAGSLAVGGTVDGLLEGVSASGEQVFSFAPGGSRLQVILGLAVSPSASRIAAVAGIDRQRLVVLGRGGTSYRVDSHRYLDSDYRFPVTLAFLDDERYVLYPRPDGIGVWAVDGSRDAVLPIKADSFAVRMDPESGVAYLVARQGQKAELVVFYPPATVLGRVPVPKGVDYLRMEGSTLYFSTDGVLARVDFRQE